MASLVHDDVIDDSDMRRGFKTVKPRWDNRIAMYTGDYIFSRALTSIGEIEIPAVHQLLAETMLEICKGEIIQIDHQRKINQTLRDYFRRIKRKTALLLIFQLRTGCTCFGCGSCSSQKNEPIRLFRRNGFSNR